MRAETISFFLMWNWFFFVFFFHILFYFFSDISERNTDYSDTLDFRKSRRWQVLFFVSEVTDHESLMLIWVPVLHNMYYTHEKYTVKKLAIILIRRGLLIFLEISLLKYNNVKTKKLQTFRKSI